MRIAFFVPLVLALFLTVAARGAAVELALPERVEVGSDVRLVATGESNATFVLSVAGGDAAFSVTNAFDARGVFDAVLPPLAEGDYLVTISSANESTTKRLSVFCGDRCHAGRLTAALTAVDARFAGWFAGSLAASAGVMIVVLVAGARAHAEVLRALGGPGRARFRWPRFLISPSAGASRRESNPRLAFDAEKAKVVEALQERFEERPAGRDPAWESETAALMRAYIAVDKNVADAVRAQVPLSPDLDSESLAFAKAPRPEPTLPVRDAAREMARTKAAVREMTRKARTKRARTKGLPRALAGFLAFVLGATMVFAAILHALALEGIYFEPLRRNWTGLLRWMPDTLLAPLLLGLSALSIWGAFRLLRRPEPAKQVPTSRKTVAAPTGPPRKRKKPSDKTPFTRVD